jgi:hypothetical protein
MAAAIEKTTRRAVLQAGLGVVFVLPEAFRLSAAIQAETPVELKISDHLSPRDKHRPMRPYTLYIVLHTTEGAEAGSLDKVWRRGETHYFVTTKGSVLRIIDRDKIATHAGRSMWEGHPNIDDYSIGIEVVGRHDQDITEAQYPALRELLRQLKSIYGIPDTRVLTHSMVAYGRPNRFYPFDHRGRKRCGMIFARPDVRLKLGLTSGPQHDPDVEAKRLKVGDVELYKFLYASGTAAAAQTHAPTPAIPLPAESNTVTKDWTPWLIAREQYDRPETIYVFPDGKRLRGDQIQDWDKVPIGTRVLVGEGEDEQRMEGFLEAGKDGDSARALAGDAFDKATTIYFLPGGLIRTGQDLWSNSSSRALLELLPAGTRVLVGYVYGGYVKTRRPPSSIAGIKWNYPSTYYRFPDGRIVSGDEIDDTAIPARTLVFYQR